MRTKIGTVKEKSFCVPDISKLLKGSKNESLIFFGKSEHEQRYCLVLGVGRVTSIKTGDKFDWVKINFGRHYARNIVVKNNHARRQIYTLKKGQLAWFYGYYATITNEKGEIESIMYAIGFQGWFVPRQFDINKIDTDLPQPVDEQDQQEMEQTINELFDKKEK